MDLDRFDLINEKMQTYNARTLSIADRVKELDLSNVSDVEIVDQLLWLMDELGENQRNMGMAMLEFIWMTLEDK